MKFKKFLLTGLASFLLLLAVCLPVRYYNQKKPINSPISDILQITSVWSKNRGLVWQPQTQPDNLATEKIKILAQSGLVINLSKNKITYAKQANQVMPIASLTKIMTALVALESIPLKQKMVVSYQAAQIGEATMSLEAGEKLTLEELLYGLMLVSGNDAAFVIAENTAGRAPLFINLMNEKAKILNLRKTEFYNPHGLDQDNSPHNQSTAYELAILAKYVLDKFPILEKIVATENITINNSSDHKKYSLSNNLGPRKTYPGLVGIKPGYTEAAGYCLVGLVEKNEEKILVVLLNTPNLKKDLTSLLDYWLE
ncbi:MAG: D-alanyl-D-alanine carboxypeptidase family protein [Patescibacteria group bacterium]|jgi:D-alanyl-D-alanine carboxypeptidase (penicillin-binding protein 5/6)